MPPRRAKTLWRRRLLPFVVQSTAAREALNLLVDGPRPTSRPCAPSTALSGPSGVLFGGQLGGQSSKTPRSPWPSKGWNGEGGI